MHDLHAQSRWWGSFEGISEEISISMGAFRQKYLRNVKGHPLKGVSLWGEGGVIINTSVGIWYKMESRSFQRSDVAVTYINICH